MMLETMNAFGADSLPAIESAILQSSAETTFYVLADLAYITMAIVAE
jgi:spore maturation protein SpmB